MQTYIQYGAASTGLCKYSARSLTQCPAHPPAATGAHPACKKWVHQTQGSCAGGKRERGLAFAPSLLEESDVYGGELADYTDEKDNMAGYDREIVSDEETDDRLEVPGMSM